MKLNSNPVTVIPDITNPPVSGAMPGETPVRRTLWDAAWSLSILALAATTPLQAAPELVLNPYQQVDWEAVGHHRANLHTHSIGHVVRDDGSLLYATGEVIGADGRQLRPPQAGHEGSHEWSNPHPEFVAAEGRRAGSDGRLRVDEVIDEYHRRGYTILAITDHDRVTWPWQDYARDPAELGMLAIVANELTREIHHMLSLFCDYEPGWGGRDFDRLLAGIGEAGGVGVVAHPSRDWPINFLQPEVRALEMPLEPGLRGLTRGDFTVESWFRTEDEGRNILLGNYRPDAVSLNLELHTDNRVRVYLSGGLRGRTLDLNVDAGELDIDTRDGLWHHLAATREGAVISLYLDGRLIGQREDVVGSVFLEGGSIYVGRDSRTGGTAFDGSLDHVRIWQRALSAEEVASVQTGAVPEGGLLRWHDFEGGGEAVAAGEPVAGEVADVSGHASGSAPAIVSASGAPVIDDSAPPALVEAGLSSRSLRFGDAGRPDGMPDEVFARYVGIYRDHPHIIGIEVLNGTRPLSEYVTDRELWDRLLTELMPGRPVWGFATDDMHAMTQLGRDWVEVLTDRLDEASVRAAMESGAFLFASTRPVEGEGAVEATPVIRELSHCVDSGTLAARATEGDAALGDDAYRWIADGEVVHTGPVLDYRTTAGIGNHVRLEVTGRGGMAYSNPFGFRPAATAAAAP